MTPLPAHESPAAVPLSSPATSPATPSPVAQQVVTLTLWIPATRNNQDAQAEWQALQTLTEGFLATRPHLHIRYIRKKASGAGGLVDFLRSAREVAPTVLPDLVILPTSQVETAIRNGQLQPLDDVVVPSVVQDLYGFATANILDGHLLAMGLAADLEHLAYDPIRLDHPPSSWQDVLDEKQPFLFPAAGEGGQVNDVTLIQYMAVGGMLIDSKGEAAIDKESLLKVFSFYSQAVSQGIILSDTLQISTSDEAWAEYLKGKAAMSSVSSWRFLQDGLRRNTTSFAPLPTIDGRTATLTRGWSLGLISDNTDRFSVIRDYITWLYRPSILGQWCREQHHLPAIRSALNIVVPDATYRTFLNTQLESAGVRPASPAAVKSGNAMQLALQKLLAGTLSPDAAVQAAVNALHKK